MENEIKTYLLHIAMKFENRPNSFYYTENQEHFNRQTISFRDSLKTYKGSQYIKVVKESSVHSFIVLEDGPLFKKGDILKAASWKAPAKNFARGNVFDVTSYINVDWTGA